MTDHLIGIWRRFELSASASAAGFASLKVSDLPTHVSRTLAHTYSCQIAIPSLIIAVTKDLLACKHKCMRWFRRMREHRAWADNKDNVLFITTATGKKTTTEGVKID